LHRISQPTENTRSFKYILLIVDDAVAAFNPTKRINGKTIIRVRP